MAVAKCSIACAYTTEEKHIYNMNRQQTMIKLKININIIDFLVVANVYIVVIYRGGTFLHIVKMNFHQPSCCQVHSHNKVVIYRGETFMFHVINY